MSWSVAVVGTPVKVVEAMKAQAERLNGQSRIEYDAALPHLVGLVEQNFNVDPANQTLIRVEACGSGTTKRSSADGANWDQVERSCVVKIERIYGALV